MTVELRPWQFRTAKKQDQQVVVSLLSDSDLPTADLEQHLEQFLLAFDGEKLAGCIGMEFYGTVALFRSLAVLPDYRCLGLGVLLANKMLNKAGALGVMQVYLLTTTASGFFPRLGFKAIPREKAPLDIAATLSFRELCPGSAVLMRLSLDHMKSKA